MGELLGVDVDVDVDVGEGWAQPHATSVASAIQRWFHVDRVVMATKLGPAMFSHQ